MDPRINALVNVLCLSSGTNANFVSVNDLKPYIESGQIDLADLRQKAIMYQAADIISLLDHYTANGIPGLGIESYKSPLNDLDLSAADDITFASNDVDYESCYSDDQYESM